jgi:hypothetical protein
MNMHRNSFALFVALAASVTGLPNAGAAGGFVIVVNAANPLSSLSRSDVKGALTGRTKQWASGAVVQLGIIPADVAETQYLAGLVDLTPRELLAHIQEQIFKGELRRPVTLHSSAECVAFARSSPGAICAASDSVPLTPEVRAVVVH